VVIRIFAAVIIGGLLGLERGLKNRPAGMRTYMLVCVGFCLIMLTNQYVVQILGGEPTRLAAQIVSGIGFLGAGTIIVTRRNQIKGLTTAAGLWSSAGVGIALGIGFYEAAIVGTFAIFAVYRYGLLACKPLFYWLGGALVFKYVVAVIALSVVYGSFDITQDYTGYIVSLLIEGGLAAAAVHFTHKYTLAHNEQARTRQNAAAALGISTEAADPLLPFAKTFGVQNPLQRVVVIVMGIYTMARLAAFIISDIAYSMMGVTFTAADIPVMLIYWILEIFIPCFLGYLLIIYTLKLLDRKA
jgi:hypothetical protein